REARGRQNAVLSRLETATNRAKMRNMYAGPRVDEAFAKFEIMERRVDLAEGRAEVFELGKVRTLEDEFAELRTGDAVDAEFEELKNRVAQQKAAE
ncbi:MAG: phage shock protein PspA, partial [Sphingomonadaceae bacterium]|nr:phage shock protein PspA [Sphingomonadaceae bacterium]